MTLVLRHFCQVCCRDVSHNKLTSLPDDFVSTFPILRFLCVWHCCRLSTRMGDADGFCRVCCRDVSDNKLTSLPDNFVSNAPRVYTLCAWHCCCLSTRMGDADG